MTMAEMISGIISLFCLLGMGFILGVAGPYGRYLDASAKFMDSMNRMMVEGMDLYKKTVKRELDD